MNTTNDFKEFSDSIPDKTPAEIYELYCAAEEARRGNESEAQNLFSVKLAKGNDENGNMLIQYIPSNISIRLTPTAAEYFPKWIEENLMYGMDAEAFDGFERAMDKND